MLTLRTYYLHLLLLVALLITLAYAAPLVAQRVATVMTETPARVEKVKVRL